MLDVRLWHRFTQQRPDILHVLRTNARTETGLRACTRTLRAPRERHRAAYWSAHARLVSPACVQVLPSLLYEHRVVARAPAVLESAGGTRQCDALSVRRGRVRQAFTSTGTARTRLPSDSSLGHACIRRPHADRPRTMGPSLRVGPQLVHA